MTARAQVVDNKGGSAPIKDLEERVAAAAAAVEAARAKVDDEAELRALEAEDEARVELHAALTRARKLAGLRLVREAKAEAAGAYQVGFYDVAAGLPQIDPAKLPASGVVLFRSPSTDVRKKYEAKAGAAEEKGDAAAKAEATIDLICACTLSPKFALNDPAAVAYRVFWEQAGRGLIYLAALHIQKLGGLQIEDFKSAAR
jgi:hypothetical protein